MAKSGEGEQKEKSAASSRGEAGVEVQLSRGGVPMDQITTTSSPRDSSTKKTAEEENKEQSENKARPKTRSEVQSGV